MKYAIGTIVELNGENIEKAIYNIYEGKVGKITNYYPDTSFPYVVQFDGRIIINCLEEEIQIATTDKS